MAKNMLLDERSAVLRIRSGGGRGFLNPFGRCRKQIIKNIL